ncbi:hypothetical protein JCM8202_000322 [Rhodotorula sphaerocarpa]
MSKSDYDEANRPVGLTPQSRRRLGFSEERPDLANLVRAVYRGYSRERRSSVDTGYRVIELADLWDRIWTAFPQLEEMHEDSLDGDFPVPACAPTLRFVAEAWFGCSLLEWLSQLPELRRLWCSFDTDMDDTPFTTAPLPFSLTELRLIGLSGDQAPFLDLIRASRATLRSLDLHGALEIMPDCDFSGLPVLEHLVFDAYADHGQSSLAHELLLARRSLPTLTRLKTLVIRQYMPYFNTGGLFEIIAHPEIVPLLPRTLKRIDCDDTPSVEECERLFGHGSAVRVLGVSTALMQAIARGAGAQSGASFGSSSSSKDGQENLSHEP